MWVAVTELLERGASPTATDNDGRTPLDYVFAACCNPSGGSATPAAIATAHSSDATHSGGGRSDGERVAMIRTSRAYRHTPDKRKAKFNAFLEIYWKEA
jgi:hypothetical protein